MRVIFYHRKPHGANFSIERLFADVRAAMPKEVVAKVAVSRYPSRGIWKRLYNTIEATFRQGDINHITGDVHFLALLLRKRKTILTIHDLVSLHRLKGVHRILFLIFWYWLPIKRSSVVTAISYSTRNELLANLRIDPDKVCIIYDPVSAAFQPTPKEFNTAKPIVLQVGVGADKNVERLAEALQGISCHLMVIGHLSYTQIESLRNSGIEYSSVSNISDAEVVEEYRLCDMLVFASTYEGFGLPIVEAQATGRPVVTSNILSMPEVAGRAACLVDPFSAASIREGIVKVIQDSSYREELVRLGFENVKRFRPEKIARDYLDIYRRILQRR